MTASFTTQLILLLWTCCHGRDGASLKAQISVLGVAPSHIRSIACDTTALTGQHIFGPTKAWWDSIYPWLPFFSLSKVKLTSLICWACWLSSSGRMWCSSIKNFISQIWNCWVHLMPFPCWVYLPILSKKSNECQFTNCFQSSVVCCSCGPVDVVWDVHWDSNLLLCYWVGMSVCLGLHGNRGVIDVGASLV